MHCQIWIVYSDTSLVWNFCACSSAVIRRDTHANVSIAKCRLLPQAWAANKPLFLGIQVRANSQTKGLELGSDAKNTLRGVWGALEALTLLLRHTKSILRRKKIIIIIKRLFCSLPQARSLGAVTRCFFETNISWISKYSVMLVDVRNKNWISENSSTVFIRLTALGAY